MLRKKIWASFQRIIDFFTQKFVTKLLKIWGWDLGSGKTYFGSRIRVQGSKRHRIPDPDPQHCYGGVNAPSKFAELCADLAALSSGY
jgi:hypothetical protein